MPWYVTHRRMATPEAACEGRELVSPPQTSCCVVLSPSREKETETDVCCQRDSRARLTILRPSHLRRFDDTPGELSLSPPPFPRQSRRAAPDARVLGVPRRALDAESRARADHHLRRVFCGDQRVHTSPLVDRASPRENLPFNQRVSAIPFFLVQSARGSRVLRTPEGTSSRARRYQCESRR